MTEIPVAKIGRREFPVPELVVEQMRVVYPAIGRLSRFFAGGPQALLSIDGETWGLLLDTVFIGIAKGSPGFTRREFDALPAKPIELIEALNIIARQGGMSEEGDGERKPGEAEATSQ